SHRIEYGSHYGHLHRSPCTSTLGVNLVHKPRNPADPRARPRPSTPSCIGDPSLRRPPSPSLPPLVGLAGAPPPSVAPLPSLPPLRPGLGPVALGGSVGCGGLV